jgi:hypothetical protein
MKNISPRTRIVFVSLLIALVYALSSNIEFGAIDIGGKRVDLLKAIVLMIITYLGSFWSLFFNVRGERFLTLLFFPSFGVFLISLLGELIIITILSGLGQVALIVSSTISLGMYVYIVLLTVNILNRSYLENIPLALAARGALFILALLDAYLVFFMIFSNDLNIFVRLFIVFISSSLLINTCLWSVEYSFKSRMLVAGSVSILLCFLSFVLSLWPLIPPYLALVMSLVFYVFLNISMEIREIIGKWIWIEYFVLFVLILLFLLLLPEWGINGPLI